jgi:acetyltransferase-like isoleucine patch superfamily enzyme/glycosyltransferase involved in cell wall biosynthesis
MTATASVQNSAEAGSTPAPSPRPRPAWTGPRPPVSVVILTLNEETNIAHCIESCAWCDDVHVLDSGSEDRTRQVAESLGAQVHTHTFESFGRQRNWAIDNIPLKHVWVFHLDADERFTPELVAELEELLRDNPPDEGFHCPSKLMFMGRWLKRAGGYPTYQMRLFHKGRMRFKDYGHGQREDTEQRLRRLRHPYLHYNFSKGLYDWVDKHNRYSTLEALQIVSASGQQPSLTKVLSPDPVERRRAWKDLGYRAPLRPAIRWFITLFVQGGILEGRAGWTYAQLLATYERMITLKLRLLRREINGAPVGFERDPVPQPQTRVFEAGQMRPATGRTPPPPTAPDDPPVDGGQLVPESSPWSFREKVIRAVWMLCGRPLFRISFHNWYGLRAALLRLFGAKIGKEVRIRPTVHIEIPWTLDIRDGVTVGDYAILYSLGTITIGERTIISQYAHLCAGTHDHTDRRFPLIRDPIEIGPDAWIGADAFVGPNVRVGRLSVLGARSSAYRDIEPATVYVGNPARPLKKRELQ